MWLKTFSNYLLGIAGVSILFTVILILNPKLSPKELFHSKDNWVLMLDISGSMVGEKGREGDTIIYGNDIFNEAQEELTDLALRYLEAGSLYELYVFNEKTRLIASGIVDGENKLDFLVSEIKEIDGPTGNTTCLSGALSKDSKRTKALSEMNNQPTRLLLVTDGFDSPDICPPLEDGVKLGVTYRLSKEYLRLYPLGYASSPSKNPFFRYCFLDPNSSKLTYFQIISIAIITLIPLSICWHFFFIYFVSVSINDKDNFNRIGGIIAWFYNQWQDVVDSQSNPLGLRGNTWKYGIAILLHSIPASVLAFYLFCYLLTPLLIVNGLTISTTVILKLARI